MNKYCYMTLLTSDSYIDGVLLLAASLKATKSEYPLLCLVTERLSETTLNTLTKYNISYKVVESISMPKKLYDYNLTVNPQYTQVWYDTFTKFRIWQFTEFNKIIFLDADLLILKNLDHCFEFNELTAAIDGEYFNLWTKKFIFNSGFMVIEPNLNTFNNLISFLNNLDPEELLKENPRLEMLADQDILNLYFADWKNHPEKQLNKYYNVFAPYIITDYEEDLIANCYFIHFIGLKPWQEKDFYKLLVTKSFRSNYFYCLAGAIIAKIKDDADGVISDFNELKTNFAIDKLYDPVTAAKLTNDERIELANEVKPYIIGLLKQIYKRRLTGGGLLFTELISAEVGETDIILKFYDAIESSIISYYDEV